ncbi:MAG: SDR family oxidoreductase [Roseiarcus sp.]
MDLGLAGRCAIVCASSKGLGRACASELARAGCRVVINGRDRATAERTAAEIHAETGAETMVVAGDLDDAGVRDALFSACPAPDVLVNNNGGPPARDFEAITREDILKGVEANMITPIALAQRALPGMAQRKFGRVINITSASVRTPIARLDVSSGARAGLTAFLASAARKYARHNVTINSIQPGLFDTDRVKQMFGGGDNGDAARANRSATIPAERIGTPEEFGKLCAFLASAHAGYIVGQNILIDGGAFPGAF